MPPPRALVLGASGLLGRQVAQTFSNAGYEVTATAFTRAWPPALIKVDIQDVDAVARLLAEIKPHVVVNCAADPQPDSCTRDPDEARRMNVEATEGLAKACKAQDAFLIWISTEYVFPGVKGEAPYKTSDTPKPTTEHGETRLAGEEALLRIDGGTQRAVVLRVPALYGSIDPAYSWKKKGAVNALMDSLWKSQGLSGDDRIKVDNWAIHYPTNTEDVARVCLDVAKLYTSRGDNDDRKKLPSILQFSSEDRMTEYDIIQKLAEIMALPLDGIVPDRNGGIPGPDETMRPCDCHLDTNELKRLGIGVSTMDFVGWWRREVGAYRR